MQERCWPDVASHNARPAQGCATAAYGFCTPPAHRYTPGHLISIQVHHGVGNLNLVCCHLGVCCCCVCRVSGSDILVVRHKWVCRSQGRLFACLADQISHRDQNGWWTARRNCTIWNSQAVTLCRTRGHFWCWITGEMGTAAHLRAAEHTRGARERAARCMQIKLSWRWLPKRATRGVAVATCMP